MVTLAHVFNSLRTKRVLVAGDFVLDRYTFGKAKRISPEAPVPVVLVEREEAKPGGAGNVVLNLLSMGMKPACLGRVGRDPAGELLRKELEQEGACTAFLVEENGFYTPHKTRVIASNQQIVRIDSEPFLPMSKSQEENILAKIPEIVAQVDLVAISDYAKGFLSERLLATLIQAARARGITVISDPKGTDFKKYAGSSILKPNLSEALAMAPAGCQNLLEISRHIFNIVNVDALMVTRSEAGISLFYPEGRQEDYAVEAREVKDVTGAGDTVLAMLSCALANELPLAEATQLCNLAAQVAVEKVGCARVTLSEVARRLIDMHAHHKIFAEEHLAALKQALSGHPFFLLGLESSKTLDAQLLKSVRQVAASTPHELVVALMGPSPDEELVSSLAALKDVDYLFLTPKNQASLIQELQATTTHFA